MSYMEYLYSVNIKDDVVVINLNIKDDWIKNKRITSYISDNVSSVMDYFGYEQLSNDLCFIGKLHHRTKSDIIKELNNSRILEYNEDFNDCSLTYVYSENKYKDGYRFFATPKIHWILNESKDKKEIEPHIKDFLTSIGFKHEKDNVFFTNQELTMWYYKVSEFKYLEFDSKYDDYTFTIFTNI